MLAAQLFGKLAGKNQVWMVEVAETENYLEIEMFVEFLDIEVEMVDQEMVAADHILEKNETIFGAFTFYVDNLLVIFDPSLPFCRQFIYWGLCTSVDIWIAPPSPLSTQNVNTPKTKAKKLRLGADKLE